MSATYRVRYEVAFAKNDVATDGPDDADATFTCPAKVAGANPTVAYMQGTLKAAGHTGAILDALQSGAAATVLSRLASRP